MLGNYFFVDGSALTAQIRQLWRTRAIYAGRKLCPVRLMRFLGGDELEDFHEGQYKRATFYFPDGDQAAIEEFLIMPDRRKPGEIRDVHFKFCGQKLKKSAEFSQFVEMSVPAKFQDRFQKSEKGIDIEICCDGLKLASGSRLDRLFLLSNDDDFVPFCRALKEFGANISIIHLSELVTANVSLLHEVDSYHVVPFAALDDMFLPQVVGDTAQHADELIAADADVADKPDAEEGSAETPSAEELKEEEEASQDADTAGK